MARFTDRLQTGKMNDSVDFFFAENLAQARFVTDIAFIKRNLLARKLGRSFERFPFTVVKIIDHNNVVAGFYQFNTGMGTDIAGSSGNKN